MSNEIVHVNFEDEKVRQLIERAGKKGIRIATFTLRKIVKNSIRKSSAKKKIDFDLKIFFPKAGVAIKNCPSVPAEAYFDDFERAREQIVVRDSKRDTRTPQKKYTWTEYTKKSASGSPPISHPANEEKKKSGWYDYWLKKSIQCDPKTGVVYVNPVRGGLKRSGMDRPLPQLLELGGTTASYTKSLIGYAVTKKYFKNGKINVAYSKVYDKKYKTYTAQKRPFMKQSLTKAYPSIMKNLQEAIQKDLAKKKKVK